MARLTDGIYAYMHVSRNQHHREPLRSRPTIWATRMPRGSSQTRTHHHRHKWGTASHGLHQVNRLQHGAPLACSGGAHSHAPRHRISALGGRMIPVADQNDQALSSRLSQLSKRLSITSWRKPQHTPIHTADKHTQETRPARRSTSDDLIDCNYKRQTDADVANPAGRRLLPWRRPL